MFRSQCRNYELTIQMHQEVCCFLVCKQEGHLLLSLMVISFYEQPTYSEEDNKEIISEKATCFCFCVIFS